VHYVDAEFSNAGTLLGLYDDIICKSESKKVHLKQVAIIGLGFGVILDEDILAVHDAMEFHLGGRHWLTLCLRRGASVTWCATELSVFIEWVIVYISPSWQSSSGHLLDVVCVEYWNGLW
jgi:hypothetical protein